MHDTTEIFLESVHMSESVNLEFHINFHKQKSGHILAQIYWTRSWPNMEPIQIVRNYAAQMLGKYD